MLLNLTVMKVDENQLDHLLCGQAVSVLPVSLFRLRVLIGDSSILDIDGIGLGTLYSGILDNGVRMTISRDSGTNKIQFYIANVNLWDKFPITIVCSSNGYNTFQNTFIVYGYDVDLEIVMVTTATEQTFAHITGWSNPITRHKHYYTTSSAKGLYEWYEGDKMVSTSKNHITTYEEDVRQSVLLYRQSYNECDATFTPELIALCNTTANTPLYNLIPNFNAELENNAEYFTVDQQLAFSVITNDISMFKINNIPRIPNITILMKIVVYDLYQNIVYNETIIEYLNNFNITRWFNLTPLDKTSRYLIKYSIEMPYIFACNKELILDAKPLGFLRNISDNKFMLTNINNVSSHLIIKAFNRGNWAIMYDGVLPINEVAVFEINDGFHLLSIDGKLYGFVAYANVIKKVNRYFDTVLCGCVGHKDNDCSCNCSPCQNSADSFNCSLFLFISVLEVSLRDFYAKGVNFDAFTTELENKYKVWNKAIFNILKS